MVIPLQRRGERIGAMMLVSRASRTISETEIAHVEAMADLLSVALANADLVETLRKAEWRFRTLFRVAPDAVLTLFAERPDSRGERRGAGHRRLASGAGRRADAR